MLTSLSVVVFLAGLPLRLSVALFLSFIAMVVNIVAAFHKSWAGAFDMLVASFAVVLLIRIFWAYEKSQRLIVLQESIQILGPSKGTSAAGWTNMAVVPSNSERGDDMCRRSASGVKKIRSSLQEPSVVFLRCKADHRIEETTLAENAFFGEDVSGKELLTLFRPSDRKALSAAMAEANAVDSAVVISAEVGQGRHGCFVRILPAGMNDQKWLAVFCKDQNMMKNPPLQKNVRKPLESAMTQTNPLDVQLQEVHQGSDSGRAARRTLCRNGTWANGEVDLSQTSVEEAVQMLRRGFSACALPGRVDDMGAEVRMENRGSRNNTNKSLGALVNFFEHLEQASMGSKPLKNWHQQVSSGTQGDLAEQAAAPSSFTLAEPSMIGGMLVYQAPPVDQLNPPLRSGSGKRMGSPRAMADSNKGSVTLSYSISLSQASCSHTVSSASKAAKTKEDASVQTDVAWTSQGWHCRACSKPPKPGSAPIRLPASDRRKPPRFDGVASMQGGWRLVDGPDGVAEWLKAFVISGTTVHSKSHHFPLLEGADGGVEMAGGALEVTADGRLIRHGKSGHSFMFHRGRVDVEFHEVPKRQSSHSDCDLDTGIQDAECLSRAVSAMSFASNGSLRIGAQG